MLKKLLHRLFDIRDGETRRALLMFGYIFLVISCLLIVKPVRNALFLDRFSAADLPYAFILVAFAAALVTSFYGRFAIHIRLDMLIRFSLIFLVSNLLIFRLLLYYGYQSGWFIYMFYVWVSIFGVIATSQFWILANYIFNAREAKRLFGLIGAGAISGGIFGGYLTNYLAPIVGTDNLLLICAFFLLVCIFILHYTWKLRTRDSQVESTRQQRQMRDRQASKNPFVLLTSSRHMAYLAGIVAVGVIAANLVDYQYNTIVEQSITNKDARTAFFGFWLSTLSIVSLLIQLFFTSRFLSSFGVGPSLFLLPIGILGGAIAILLYPVLWAAIIIKVSEGSFKQSINKAGLELLVLPIPSNIKAQAKSFIDIFVDSIATGIGGVLIILCTAWLQFTVGQFSLLLVPLIILWIVLILGIRKEYTEAFRIAIEKRAIDLDDHLVNLQDASLFRGLLQILKGDNERQISYVLNLLENVKNDLFIPYLVKLLDHPADDIRLEALTLLESYTTVDLSQRIEKSLHDTNQNIRIAAINYLSSKAAPPDRRQVLSDFLESDDYRIQGAAFVCTAQAISNDPHLQQHFQLHELIAEKLQTAGASDQMSPEQIAMRTFVAQAIGIAKIADLYPQLTQLLIDPAVEVRAAASISAGETGDSLFVPKLIALLKDKHIRKFARKGLAAFGEDIIPWLGSYLADHETDITIRLNIPKVLSEIGAQTSIDLLTEQLNQDNLQIRFQILKGLNRLRKNFPMLKFNDQKVEGQILEEAKNYLSTLAVLYTENNLGKSALAEAAANTPGTKHLKNTVDARSLLIRALEEKLDRTLERIFRLLGLKYIPRDMFNAYLGIVSKKQDLQANAVEFLDNILDNTLKRSIIPIVETNSFDTLLDIGKLRFNIDIPSEQECLLNLLDTNDKWLTSCALFLIAAMRDNQFSEQVEQLSKHTDHLVRETAEYAATQMAKQ